MEQRQRRPDLDLGSLPVVPNPADDFSSSAHGQNLKGKHHAGRAQGVIGGLPQAVCPAGLVEFDEPPGAAKITTVLTMPEITEGNFMLLWDIFMLSLFDARKLDISHEILLRGLLNRCHR